jgi:hypothetical protein
VAMKTNSKANSEIPKFDSEQEAAEFWDTHSPLDFHQEFESEPVEVENPIQMRGLTVKLSVETIEALRTLARQQGIGPSTLARMWILKQLNETHKSDKASPPRR